VSCSHIERYQRYLYRYSRPNGQPLSLSTQRGALVVIRGFFRWLSRENLILYNPAADIELPRKGVRLPRGFLTVAQVEQVLAGPAVSKPRGLRDRALLETLYSTGIRLNEVCKLKLNDLDRQRGTLFVRAGKGRKDRVVPIGRRALYWLDRYLNEVRPSFAREPDDGSLFLSGCRRGALARESVKGLVQNYVREAKIGVRGGCHLFRHSMATLMLENGADIRSIQEILGHADLTSTQVYAQVTVMRLKEVYERTHPGARLKSRAGENEHENEVKEAKEVEATKRQ
jgi:integrase/recombinase XerD